MWMVLQSFLPEEVVAKSRYQSRPKKLKSWAKAGTQLLSFGGCFPNPACVGGSTNGGLSGYFEIAVNRFKNGTNCAVFSSFRLPLSNDVGAICLGGSRRGCDGGLSVCGG